MLQPKFQDHRTKKILNVFTICGHCGHLGYVTWTIYKRLFPFPKEASHKIWL